VLQAEWIDKKTLLWRATKVEFASYLLPDLNVELLGLKQHRPQSQGMMADTSECVNRAHLRSSRGAATANVRGWRRQRV
jgi:hypothetical protein